MLQPRSDLPPGAMPETAKRRQPSSGGSEDALPAAPPRSFPLQWRSTRLVQRERREETDELWRRLDDLVTDASDFPSPRDSFAFSTPSPRPRPSNGDCDQSSLASLMGVVIGCTLMGVVIGCRADWATHQRGSSGT